MKFNSYIHRRDLHTVLPKHAVLASNNRPRLSKTMPIDDKIDTKANSQLKRPILNSTSSDLGTVTDSDNDMNAKRPKLEDISESSPKISESNLDSV